MARLAERHQIRQRVAIATLRERDDVMNLQPLARAATLASFGVALPRFRSRSLPSRAVASTPLDAMTLVVRSAARAAAVVYAGAGLVVLAAVVAEPQDHPAITPALAP